jgi:hypothetical protein
MSFLMSLSYDVFGNVFVAEHSNQLIRKITQNGTVTTIAGAATSSGYIDGLSSVSRFLNPMSIAMDLSGNLFVAEENNHLIRKLTLNCMYTSYGNHNLFNIGMFRKGKNSSCWLFSAMHGIYGTDYNCMLFHYITMECFSTCNTQGTSTRTRTGTAACTTELSETIQCCYTLSWTNSTTTGCNTSTGIIAQVRTTAGNCDASVATTQNVPCCQLGSWVSGTCQTNGTLTKTRTVSSLCPSTELPTAQEACCYISNWTTTPNAQCDTSTGLIAQVRTKAGNCDASVTTTQNAPCCQLGIWSSGACQPDGTLTKTRTVSQLCPSTESSTTQESCCYT